MKKILFVIPDYSNLNLRVFSHLKKLGFDVDIAAPYPIKYLEVLSSLFFFHKKTQKKINRRAIDWKNAMPGDTKIISVTFISLLKTLIEGYRKNIVFSNSLKKILEYEVINQIEWKNYDYIYAFDTAALPYLKHAQENNLKIILESRGSNIDHALEIKKRIHQEYAIKLYKTHPEGLQWYEKIRQEAKMSDYIVTYSSYHKKQFTDRGFNENKIIKLPISAKYEKQKKTVELKDGDTLTFMFMGSIYTRKGIRNLLNAWKNVSKKYTERPMELKLIGQVGKDIDLKSIPSNVRNLGYLFYEQLKEEIKSSHVFVFPTLDDSFAMVILEAMSFNLPVITTVNCGASDFIKDQHNGLIMKDPFSQVELEEKLEFFIKNPEQVKMMSEAQSITAEYSKNNELQLLKEELIEKQILI